MVEIIQTTEELNVLRDKESQEIGFVPTMGNLHAGHISLLQKALSQYKVVYFSIFVNPKQFGPTEDFNRYPRTLDQDVLLIKNALKEFPESRVVVFAPKSPDEIYPDGSNQIISVCNISEILEGKSRPGHFEGVATVVHRLFEIIRPSSAYFGLKDYQQFLVIKQMVQDLQLPTRIIGMPIVREESGLALSSHNQYLSPDEKLVASHLSNTLNIIKKKIDGKRSNIIEAKLTIRELLKDNKWDYLELRDGDTLSEDLDQAKTITILAVYKLGTTRLLDNMQVELK